eukprot:scaffold160098_cov30-Tisochrysis_lutea.AAC.1
MRSGHLGIVYDLLSQLMRSEDVTIEGGGNEWWHYRRVLGTVVALSEHERQMRAPSLLARPQGSVLRVGSPPLCCAWYGWRVGVGRCRHVRCWHGMHPSGGRKGVRTLSGLGVLTRSQNRVNRRCANIWGRDSRHNGRLPGKRRGRRCRSWVKHLVVYRFDV